MARKPAAKKTAAKKAPVKKAASKLKYKFILVNKRKGVCNIQLNRPEFLNAMNIEMAQEICDVLVEVEQDRKIVAIILSGNERAFCAGADLGRMGSKPEDRFDMYRERFNIAPHLIDDLTEWRDDMPWYEAILVDLFAPPELPMIMDGLIACGGQSPR